ncbi:N-acetylmuramoyl-L-alanine amidase [Streptomyces sp. NBC_00237]|uniref:N-acetylmuramoyl-L-alanine amidase n=1 Tax=Streptomyces sp. NBC_00237 TaxID=2975687 RepID=UPI00224F6151|nr:N-acetylmuramoyl-L-alanine amidase [Streptomyces sp. NBC_00237]MCX5201544.1 N-acetylmuramoyl-L-alanine amidase [Streptomyces sp. NBC_00237]
MSYDGRYPHAEPPEPEFGQPRRRGRGNALIVVAALVPTALAGWLVWQAMSGPEGDQPPKVLPLPSRTTTAAAAQGATGAPAPSAPPSTTPSAPAKSTQSAAPDAPDDRPVGGPLSGRTVVVDPGHNPGNFRHTREINRQVNIGTNSKECDTTGTASNAGYTEAEFTLDVSRRLKSLLEKQGATVKFTQNADRPFGPCIDERARIGNEAKADAVLSIHADGSSAGHRGFHVILPARVKSGAADTSSIVGPSRVLGEAIVGNFVRETGDRPANYLGAPNGLVVRRDLGGLNLSTVPKVFIECGNMRDSKDIALLTDPSWRQKAAQGMADGISAFLKG